MAVGLNQSRKRRTRNSLSRGTRASRGKKKLQHGPYTGGPTGLVVHAAGHALKVQCVAGTPAVGYQPPVELRGILEGSTAFAVAHIEP
jgi:hypothetical protein